MSDACNGRIVMASSIVGRNGGRPPAPDETTLESSGEAESAATSLGVAAPDPESPDPEQRRRLLLATDRTFLSAEVNALETGEASLASSDPPNADPLADPLASGSGPRVLIDGRYEVAGRLGSGAMGVVYRVEDILLQRPAAIKLLDSAIARTPAAEKNLIREARALARLRHSNVVQVYSFGSYAGRLFFAMEYVDGESLEDLIFRMSARDERLPLERVLDIVTSVASGLSEAHAHGIIHRDVKPSNIVIEGETGRPVLIDFGIAREVTGAVRSSFVVAGTPTYMAPEQASHERSLFSHKVDLYALACTTFELLTGRPVFESDDAYVMLHAHVSRTPPTVSSLRPELAALDSVLARALAKSPQYRHASCTEFALDLANTARRAGLLGAASAGDATSAKEEPLQKRRVLALVPDDRVRQVLVTGILTSLRAPGSTLHIECTTEPSALLASFAETPAEVVILDDDVAEGAAIALTHQLRSMAGAEETAPAQILVIARNIMDRRAEWQALGARRLSKPLSTRALAQTLDEIGARLRTPRRE